MACEDTLNLISSELKRSSDGSGIGDLFNYYMEYQVLSEIIPNLKHQTQILQSMHIALLGFPKDYEG